MTDHRCFGCGKQLGDMESHIHVGLDEWGAKQGLEALGMDEFLTMAFCEDCTQKSKDGWTPEQHIVSDEDSA